MVFENFDESCSDQNKLSNGEYQFDARCKIDKCKPGLVKSGIPAKCIATGTWSKGIELLNLTVNQYVF